VTTVHKLYYLLITYFYFLTDPKPVIKIRGMLRVDKSSGKQLDLYSILDTVTVQKCVDGRTTTDTAALAYTTAWYTLIHTTTQLSPLFTCSLS